MVPFKTDLASGVNSPKIAAMNPRQRHFSTKRAASKEHCRPVTVRRVLLPAAVLGVAALTGCASVGLEQQRLVSKPNMEFGRSAVFSYSSKILPQVLPGLAGMPGAAATTCTACR